MASTSKYFLCGAILFFGAFLCLSCGGSSSGNQPKTAQQKVDEHEEALRAKLKQLEGENKRLQDENTRLVQENAMIKGERGLTADERDARYKKDRDALDEREREFEKKQTELVAKASLSDKFQDDLARERTEHAKYANGLAAERDAAKAEYQVRTDMLIYPGIVTAVLFMFFVAYLLYRAKASSDGLAAIRAQTDERVRKSDATHVTLRQGIEIFKGLSPEQVNALPPLVGHFVSEVKRLENPSDGPSG
ncbi:MAG: hypothetical protein BroJett014_22060 [Planctomycetota bacterium]|nr:MAG: hypothetical protein BroJett014_22060 [Planctomycetota bacterium]